MEINEKIFVSCLGTSKIIATILNSYAWIGKPVILMILDCAHYLASMWAIAAVLYVMQ